MILLPAGRSSTSTPASSSPRPSPLLRSGSTRRRRPSPPGKRVAGDLLEVARHRLEGLGEARPHRLGELVAELRDLGERRLEVLPLGRELLEPLLLRLVLLLGEWIDLSECLAPRVEPLRTRRELGPVVSVRRLVRARLVEPPPRLVGLGLEACELDLDERRPLRRLVRDCRRTSTSSAPSRRSSSPSVADRSAPASTRARTGRLEAGREQTCALESRARGRRPRRAAGRACPRRVPSAAARVSSSAASAARAPVRCGRAHPPPPPPPARAATAASPSAPRAVAAPSGRRCRRSCRRAAPRRPRQPVLARPRPLPHGRHRPRGPRGAAIRAPSSPACSRADRESRRKRLLEAYRDARGPAESLLEPGRESTSRPANVGSTMRSRRCATAANASSAAAATVAASAACAAADVARAGELVRLVGERPAAGIHLEQHRLGRLAREPELAALGVVAMALVRDHRSVRRVEQLPGRDEPDAVEQPERGRVARGERASGLALRRPAARRRGGIAIDDRR